MHSAARMLALVLAIAVLSAGATPCPPNPEAHLTSATGEASELGIKAKCPCSCSDGGAPRLATTHLDFAAEHAADDAPLAFVWVRLWHADERYPPLDATPLEAVPI